MADSLSLRRSKRSNAGKRLPTFGDLDLPSKWGRVHLDMDRCRLQKNIQKMKTATTSEIGQLRVLGRSFVAMSISAASAYGGGASKEGLLLEYARAVTDQGLDANDAHAHGPACHGNSAVTLAAYHGYLELLEYLLDEGYSLDSSGMYGNALEAAATNGQHEALSMLMSKRPGDVELLFANDHFSFALGKIFYKNDVDCVRQLVTKGRCKPTMNDRQMKYMKNRRLDRKHLWPVLRQLYPKLSNVASWSKPIHWSFPTSDRRALNVLWHTTAHPGEVFPKEVWLHVFSFTGRGWFKRDACETML